MAGTHTYTENTKRPNKCGIMRLRKCLHFSSLQKSDVYFKVLPYTEKIPRKGEIMLKIHSTVYIVVFQKTGKKI